jgi:hypothetical protein
MSERRFIRFISRASIEGLATPVTETKEDRVQVVFAEARAGKHPANRLFREIFGNLDPCVIRLSPGRQIVVRFDGQSEISPINTDSGQQAVEDFLIFPTLYPSAV